MSSTRGYNRGYKQAAEDGTLFAKQEFERGRQVGADEALHERSRPRDAKGKWVKA